MTSPLAEAAKAVRIDIKAAPGAGIPPSRKPKTPAVSLGEFERGWTSPGVYEVVKAVTADGEWRFERSQDGTWEAGHLPTETEVKTRLRSLSACCSYARSGAARADLERLQSEKMENGNG
jgi:hypothetical protein